MASYYSGTATYQQGGTAQVRADVTYARSGTTGYNVTVEVYQTSNKSWCPYYDYRCYQYCSINGVEKRNTTSVNPTESWKRQVLLWTSTQFVDPGGPAYSCPFSVTYRVPAGSYTFSSQKTFSISNSITLPATWVAPTQTFVTTATNTTTNNTSSSSRSFTDNTHVSGNTSYVGDSFSYTWDKNNQASVGSNANPGSYAYLARSSTNKSGSVNNHPSIGTDIHTAWGWTHGGDDLYVGGYTYTAVPADGGNYLLACMYKYYEDASGNACHFHQANGHYIQDIPTISATYTVRSRKLYRSSPSTVVVQLSAISITTNGYRIHRRNSDMGIVEFHTCTVSGFASASRGSADNGQTSNYSMSGRTYQLVWKNAAASNVSAGTYSSGVYSRYQSPNLTAAYTTGHDLRTVSNALAVVDGSFSKIAAKNFKITNPSSQYPTSASTMNFLLGWEYDGTHNNVRGDYRIERSIDGSTWGVGGISGGTVYKDWRGWTVDTDLSSTGWRIDQSGTTYVFADVSLSTTGYYYRISLIPSSTDSAGYQIFGDPIYLVSDKIYRVIIPAVPKVNYLTSILPPIVGIANDFYYKYQNTTDWGNFSPNTDYGHIRRQYYDDSHYEDLTDTSNITASGYVEGVYSKTVPSTSTGSLSLRVKSSVKTTNWSDTEFTSAQSNYKSLALIAQKKYSITASDVAISTPLATTLLRNIPFTLALPSKTINGNYLINSGSIYVDGAKSSDFNDLSYTLGDVAGWGTTFVGGNTTLGSDGVCTSISGDRSISFANKSWSTDTLTRGVHTIRVDVEILTYFDSDGVRTINGTDYNLPTNHVLFGSTGVLSSNTLTVEIGDIPAAPTINIPNPQFFNAGQERKLTWTFSPNDWGVNDTTYNNRHYDYELYNPAGTKIQSGTIAKGTTSYTYTFTPSNADLGSYKFRLRQVNVLGVSTWVESEIEIQKAIEPTTSTITTSEIVALADWDYSLSIVPGNNGSYEPVTTAPVARYKIDVVQLPKNLYNPSFAVFDSNYITDAGGGWYHLAADRTSATGVDYADFWTNWNQYLKANTDYTYVLEVRNASVNRSLTFELGDTAAPSAQFSTNFELIGDSADELNGTHFFYVKTKADMKSTLYNKHCGRDFVTLPAGCNYSLDFRISIIEGHIPEDEFSYSAYKDPYITNLTAWTNVSNGTTISRNLTHNLSNYIDGSYSLYIPYERYYTTFTSKESLIVQIIPPEIQITDASTVEWVGTDKAEFNFKMFVDIFGWCGTWDADENPHTGGCWAEYSLDYGKTWTRAYDNKADRVIEIPLTWLDEIWLRGYGANPVDTDDKFTVGIDSNGDPIKVEIVKHDMYSCYKAWLAENGVAENWTRKIHLSHNNMKEKKIRKITKE